MATTITTPANFASLRNGVIFYIDRGAAENYTDVEIIGKGNKQMSCDTIQVNVADYYTEDIDIHPLLDTHFSNNTVDTGRITEAKIAVDGITSTGCLCLGSVDVILPDVHILSDLEQRIISPGQSDEIVVCGKNFVATFNNETIQLTGELNVINVPCPELSSGTNTFSVVITGPEAFYKEIKYKITPNYGMRIGWINRYGQIDYWNFDMPMRKTIELSKSTIYTGAGYRQTGVSADEYTMIKTRAVDSETLNILKWLLVSERAWTVNGTSFEEIMIVTNKAAINSNNDIMSLEIEFKPKKRLL